LFNFALTWLKIRRKLKRNLNLDLRPEVRDIQQIRANLTDHKEPLGKIIC